MAARPPAELAGSRAPFLVACAAALIYVATFGTMGILQYQAGNVTYADSANFEEMLWRTLHGQFLAWSGGPYLFLGEHVQLIHLLLLPVYAIYPDLQTLMVIETVALGGSALIVYAIAVAVLRSRWVGAAFAVAWVLYTPLQMINLEGGGSLHTFRPEALSVPLVLAAFYFLIRGRRLAFSITAFVTLLAKEEFGLVFMMMGLYAALVLRERKLGLAWAGIGPAWFAVSLWVVIPYFRGGEQSHVVSYYSNLGDSPGQILANVVGHPVKTLEVAFASEKREFLVILFAPVAYLCLLSPLVMAITLPSLAICLLSGRYATYMPWFHYHTPIVPFIFIASAYGMRNLAGAVRRFAAPKGKPPEAAARSATTGAAILLVLAALVTNVIYSKSPLSFRFYDPESGSCYKRLYVVTPHAREIPKVVASIPRDKRVSASFFLATRFTHHAASYGFPQGLRPTDPRPADYVVLDLEERWLFDNPEQKEVLKSLEGGKEFERLPAPEGFAIFRRRANP